MEADYSAFSRQELISRICELERKSLHLSDLTNKIREHKHNYSEDFGLVVSVPMQALLNEVMSNPSLFSEKEKSEILDLYEESMEMRGFYECLGWPIDSQLARVKKSLVPLISKDVELYNSLLGSHLEFAQGLVCKLNLALKEQNSLCERLENIEYFDYGEVNDFNLRAEIRDSFNKDNQAKGNMGISQIQVELWSGDYADIKVRMNQKFFKTHVLGNIIKNLHDHAFKEIEKSQVKTERPKPRKHVPNIARIIRKRGAGGNEINSSEEVHEKRVRISFRQDPDNSDRINIIIENNGVPFDGDVTSVFEEGIGEGSGIGLYSAKQFLNHYGATILMFTNPADEYKVGFSMNLPIIINNEHGK